jgi:hypothetical protein
MLRGNLSSRPFYNQRLVTLALVLVGVIAAVLTAYNVSELRTLSGQRRALVERIQRDQQSAQQINRDAVALQKSVDQSVLRVLAAATREANDLIDQRTFSWTVFFGLIERTIPLDVHLVAVSPGIDRGNIKVTMTVVARRHEQLEQFVNALQGAGGAFYDVAPHAQQANDDGTWAATLEAFYLPPTGAPKPATAGRKNGKGRP